MEAALNSMHDRIHARAHTLLLTSARQLRWMVTIGLFAQNLKLPLEFQWELVERVRASCACTPARPLESISLLRSLERALVWRIAFRSRVRAFAICVTCMVAAPLSMAGLVPICCVARIIPSRAVLPRVRAVSCASTMTEQALLERHTIPVFPIFPCDILSKSYKSSINGIILDVTLRFGFEFRAMLTFRLLSVRCFSCARLPNARSLGTRPAMLALATCSLPRLHSSRPCYSYSALFLLYL